MPAHFSATGILRRAAGHAARRSLRHMLLVSLPLLLLYAIVFGSVGWLMFAHGADYYRLAGPYRALAGAGIVFLYLGCGALLGMADAAVSAVGALTRAVERLAADALNTVLAAVAGQLAGLGLAPTPEQLRSAINTGVGVARGGMSGEENIFFALLRKMLLGVIRSVLLARAGGFTGGVFRSAALLGDRLTLFFSVMASVKMRLIAVRLIVRGAALVLLLASALLIHFSL